MSAMNIMVGDLICVQCSGVSNDMDSYAYELPFKPTNPGLVKF